MRVVSSDGRQAQPSDIPPHKSSGPHDVPGACGHGSNRGTGLPYTLLTLVYRAAVYLEVIEPRSERPNSGADDAGVIA